jgi:hypothetical protein
VSQRAVERATRTCSRCHARIAFVRMIDTGKGMPVDPIPSLEGTVAVMRSATGDLIGRVVTHALPVLPYEQLHVTHFASCSAASPGERKRGAGTNVIDLSAARRDRRGQASLF